MGTGLRLKLLIVAGMAAVRGPNGEPPGFLQKVPAIRSEECPSCGRKSRQKKPDGFFCRSCNKTFAPKKKASTDSG